MPDIVSETRYASERRAVVLQPTRCTLLLGAMVAVAASLCLPILQRLREPVYQGRRVSAWFDDFCSTTPGDVSRYSAAIVPFSRMGSNAVPFLIKQLSDDQSGRIERLEVAARKVPLVREVAMQFVIPSQKRNCAALALGHLGTNGVSALKPMVELFRREPRHDVQRNLIVAMGAIAGAPGRPSPLAGIRAHRPGACAQGAGDCFREIGSSCSAHHS